MKLKITKEQNDRITRSLNEDKDVKGGINRVDKSFKKELSKVDVQNLDEEDFNIKNGQDGISNSIMKPKTEPKPINEDISPELQHAVSKFIENVWMNPSQHGLDKIFQQNGVTWGDIASYLTSVGMLSVVGMGLFKVNNFFKRRFRGDSDQVMKQKLEDINKMSTVAVKDPKAPWNANRLKDPKGQTKMNDVEEEKRLIVPPRMFKPVEMGKELAILSAPSGMYIFDYESIDKNAFPNADPNSYQDTLMIDDIAEYVNDNLAKISKGDGVAGFNGGAQLVLIDEELKKELIDLYSYDKKFVSALSRLAEMTSTASAGAFTGPLSGPAKPAEKELTPSEAIVDEETIEEVTTTASSGSYVQPQIWAKNKKNWKAGQTTQYPNGEMVDISSCAKLNNNKAAQNGKCNTGAVNGAVKTHKTKGSVISPSLGESKIFELIAKKTGKKPEEIKEIIKSNVNKGKALA